LDFYTTDSIQSYVRIEKIYIKEHHIIPFCRRENFEDDYIVVDNNIPSLTFDELNKHNMTRL